MQKDTRNVYTGPGTVGPGAYDVDAADVARLQRARGRTTFGRDRTTRTDFAKQAKDVPGPGDYTAPPPSTPGSQSAVAHRPTSVFASTAERDPKAVSPEHVQAPGPGASPTPHPRAPQPTRRREDPASLTADRPLPRVVHASHRVSAAHGAGEQAVFWQHREAFCRRKCRGEAWGLRRRAGARRLRVRQGQQLPHAGGGGGGGRPWRPRRGASLRTSAESALWRLLLPIRLEVRRRLQRPRARQPSAPANARKWAQGRCGGGHHTRCGGLSE